MLQTMRGPRYKAWRRGVMALALAVACVIAAAMALGNRGSASAATVYTDYSALSSTAPSEISVASSPKEAEAARGPVWIRRSNPSDGPEIQTARPVTVDVQGLRVWAAKSISGGICILTYAQGSMGVTCGNSEHLDRGVVMEMTVGSDSYLVGLAPNDVPSVTLEHNDATSTVIPVGHNIYAAPTSQRVSKVTFASAGTEQAINMGGR